MAGNAHATFQTDQQISVAVQFLTQSICGNRLVCGTVVKFMVTHYGSTEALMFMVSKEIH